MCFAEEQESKQASGQNHSCALPGSRSHGTVWELMSAPDLVSSPPCEIQPGFSCMMPTNHLVPGYISFCI